MNVIDFEQSKCRRFQTYLDSYLNNELLVETTHDVLKHLESCPACSEALAVRQRVKRLLKSAIVKDAAPAELKEKIKRSIRKDSSINWRRWAMVAAAAVVLIAVSVGVSQLWKRGAPAQ